MEKVDQNFVKCLEVPPDSRSVQHFACINSYLRTIDALKNYRDTTISEYARIARYERHKPNDVLYHMGDLCKSWYIVLCGSVMIGQKMFLPRNSFGKRTQGIICRGEECIVLEETELIVIDYSMDRQVIPSRRSNWLADREFMSPMTGQQFFNNNSSANNNNNIQIANISKRSSHASDTSSAYSCCDTQQSSSCGHVSTASDNEVDEYDDDDDDNENDIDDGVSQDISMNDIFFEALAKEPSCRLGQDIEIIVNGVQNLAAFSPFTERTRYELCRIMRVAIWNSENNEPRLLMQSGELLDTWNVVLEGLVEIRDSKTGSIREFDRGDSFGVRPSLEEQRQQGDLWTDSASCVFLCVAQHDFYEIVTRDNETIVPEIEDNGRTVLVYEQRGGNNNGETGLVSADSTVSRIVVVKGTRERLLNCLLFDRYKSDPSYMENFLLTYRVFLRSPRILANKLCQWYAAEPVEDTKTKEMIRKCLVMWANSHFADFDNPNCNMTYYLEKFDEILSEGKIGNNKALFNLACRNNSKPRHVTVKCDKCYLKNTPIQLVGLNNGFGLFVKEINRVMLCNDNWALRKGDQILSMSNKTWEAFGTLDRASEMLTSNLANSIELVVKYNPVDFQECIRFMEMKTEALNPNTNKLGGITNLWKGLKGGRYSTCNEKTMHKFGYGSVIAQCVKEHQMSHLPAVITPMEPPRLKDSAKLEFQSQHRSNSIATDFNNVNTKLFNHSGSNNENDSCYDSKNSSTTGSYTGSGSGKNRSAHASPTRVQTVGKKHPLVEKHKRSLPKDKKLSSRSSSNPNLKDLDENEAFNRNKSGKKSNSSPYSPGFLLSSSTRASETSSSAMATVAGCFDSSHNISSNNGVIAQVIKVFRGSESKFIPLNNMERVETVLPRILKEFSIDISELNNYALCTVTVNVENGVVKSSREPPYLHNLANRLALNQRYYLRNNATDSQLITDEQAKILIKESKTDIFDLSAETIATRLTHMDYSLFREIEPAEYLNLVFKLPPIDSAEDGDTDSLLSDEESGTLNDSNTNSSSKKPQGFSTGCSTYERFEQNINRQSFWPTTEICRETTLARRVELLKKFIKVAQICRDLKNFNSLICIITAITLTPVSRLKSTWEKLGSKYRKMYNELHPLTNMSFNFRCIRQLESPEVTEPPLIPCLAIHSRDLNVIHMNNKTIVKDGLLNFEKMRMLATEIRKLSQMCSSEYSLSNILTQRNRCQSMSGSSNIMMDLISSATVALPVISSFDESDATSGISSSSSTQTDRSFSQQNGNKLKVNNVSGSHTIHKDRSYSVDHSGFNGTLKKRNMKRKTLNFIDQHDNRKPQKIYEEWLMTLKFKTYWTNVDVVTEMKTLYDMSDKIEPPSPMLSNSTSNVGSGNVDQSTVSSKKSPTQPSPQQPKSSVTINLNSSPKPRSNSSNSLQSQSSLDSKSNSSSTSKVMSPTDKHHQHQQQHQQQQPQQQQQQQQTQKQLVNSRCNSQIENPNNKCSVRPPSIFSSQTPDDINKIKELAQISRIPKRRTMYISGNIINSNNNINDKTNQQLQLQQQQQQQQQQSQLQLQPQSQSSHYQQPMSHQFVRYPNIASDNVILNSLIPMYNSDNQSRHMMNRRSNYGQVMSPGSITPNVRHQGLDMYNILQQQQQQYQVNSAANSSSSFMNVSVSGISSTAGGGFNNGYGQQSVQPTNYQYPAADYCYYGNPVGDTLPYGYYQQYNMMSPNNRSKEAGNSTCSSNSSISNNSNKNNNNMARPQPPAYDVIQSQRKRYPAHIQPPPLSPPPLQTLSPTIRRDVNVSNSNNLSGLGGDFGSTNLNHPGRPPMAPPSYNDFMSNQRHRQQFTPVAKQHNLSHVALSPPPPPPPRQDTLHNTQTDQRRG